MRHLKLIPERNADGTVVLRAVPPRGPWERLRLLLRRLAAA